MNLASAALSNKIKRTVDFKLVDGVVSHTGDGPTLFSVELNYQSSTQIAEIQSSAVQRRVANAKRRTKANVADGKAAMLAVAREAVVTWRGIGRKALRALECLVDYSKVTSDISFNAENLDFLVNKSNFGAHILVCLQDFEFWFPGEEEEEGNFGSGPASSTGEPTVPAASASIPTSRTTRPDEASAAAG
jgi:hypothetical protein